MVTIDTASDLEFLTAVQDGLGRTPKTLPCRFFYDLEGSRLFDRICDTPEYYLTRAEDRILKDYSGQIAALAPEGAEVVELGSGTARKTRRLLEALLARSRDRRGGEVRYLPVDISAEMLDRTAADLMRDYPRLVVSPVAAEYGRALERLREERRGPRLFLFLGSNLGNFTPAEARGFLLDVAAAMAPGDQLLLGLDLRKDPAVLNAAYNDAAGVNAAFNLNLLRRINRELGADFDLRAFSHRAFYNPELGRVEMHLVSEREQGVRIGSRCFRFAAGETIHTENSHKYAPEEIRELGAAVGLSLKQTWCDPDRYFSLNLFEG